MYERTKWKDRIVSAGTGEVLQEGTDQNAANFNNMEHGISDHHVAMALTQITRSNLSYSVSNILDGVATSNTSTVAYIGKPYATTLEALNDKAITAVSVTMGGNDITESSVKYADNIYRNLVYISIEKVTGDIVITASNS